MPEHWLWPVSNPEIIDSHVRELAQRERDNGPKPKAFDTPFRCSAVGQCSRKLAYSALGVTSDTPTDDAGLSVMDLGNVIHEQLQAAVGRRYPEAQFEVPVEVKGLISGSADIYLPDRSEVVELKSIGRYGYEEAMGVTHPRAGKQSERAIPGGPKYAHILQAGMYAYGLGAENVTIGYVCKEAFSLTIAERMELTMLDRVMAEWHVPHNVWLPMVQAELARLKEINLFVNAETVPDRQGLDDYGQRVELDPDALPRTPAYKVSWMCRGYCPYLTQCRSDGTVPVEIRRAS